MAAKRTDREKMDALIEALGDSVFEADDAEIIEELRESGVDPDKEAARLRGMMLGTVNAFRQQALKTARAAYDQRVEQMSVKTYSIPATPQERRTLFALVAQQPQYAQFVTAQYRDLKDLTDDDIKTCLEDLDELGILRRLQHGESDGE